MVGPAFGKPDIAHGSNDAAGMMRTESAYAPSGRCPRKADAVYMFASEPQKTKATFS